MDLKQLVRERFSEPQRCYGHCEQQATLKFIPKSEMLLAGYVCPSGYLSRVIAYGERMDVASFKAYLMAALQGQEVRDEDIRLATRYSWDLGLATAKGRVMQAAYWTQNYRRTKSDNPERVASFLCSSCTSPFSQPLSAKETFCSSCRTR